MNYNRRKSKKRLKVQLKKIMKENEKHLILSANDLVEIINLLKDYRVRYGFVIDNLPEDNNHGRREEVFLEFCRKVLYFVLERLFWSQFEDSHYVGIFLNCLFEVDHDLMAVIFPESSGCRSFENLRAHKVFSYFASHAYREKLLFDGFRLPHSIRCYYAIQKAIDTQNPSVLKEMLRFGALLSLDENYFKRDYTRWKSCPASNGESVLLSTLGKIVDMNRNLLKIGDMVFDSENHKEKYENLVLCCKYLLTDFPQWTSFLTRRVGWNHFESAKLLIKDSPRLNPRLSSINGLGNITRNRKDFAEAFSDNVLPEFRTHFIEPMPLKQVCRLSIRRVMNNNWYCPSGIYDLPLPKYLKQYLDL